MRIVFLFCRTEEERKEAARKLEEWREEKRRKEEQEEEKRLTEEIQKRRREKVLSNVKSHFHHHLFIEIRLVYLYVLSRNSCHVCESNWFSGGASSAARSEAEH